MIRVRILTDIWAIQVYYWRPESATPKKLRWWVSFRPGWGWGEGKEKPILKKSGIQWWYLVCVKCGYARYDTSPTVCPYPGCGLHPFPTK